jgi:hypothetical protein
MFWMHNPSRFQLGEHLGFSKSKITNLVNALLEQAMIEEAELPRRTPAISTFPTPRSEPDCPELVNRS